MGIFSYPPNVFARKKTLQLFNNRHYSTKRSELQAHRIIKKIKKFMNTSSVKIKKKAETIVSAFEK
ncbi:hypothetical protein BZG02_06950 [Labilibaculum filiforme]|uniref:Uncharacterized protein n=1 Tax=Labilibaculum filiforme TaxID=1940526 RepID=A0A2N3I0B0_9BACT|nr:hypothetical protein BZG02_06950 [Labilibaculum filiforme]